MLVVAAHAQSSGAAPMASNAGLSASTSSASASASPTHSSSTNAPSTTALHASPLDAVASTRPFGPGFPVSLSCDKSSTHAFVAKGAVDSRPSYPDPFVKVGRLPLTVELPSGVYTVIVEGDTITSGSKVFEVRNASAQILVKAGSSGLRELSTWLMAFGGAAVLAGGVLELSRSSHEDAKQKHSISIPLFIGGGVALLSGVAMVFVSGTTFRTDAFVPGRSGGPVSRFQPGITFSGLF